MQGEVDLDKLRMQKRKEEKHREEQKTPKVIPITASAASAAQVLGTVGGSSITFSWADNKMKKPASE